jgi:hypothetical protein
MLEHIFAKWDATDAPLNAMARDAGYYSFAHWTAHYESTNPRYHAASDPYEEMAYAATDSDDGYDSSDEAFYEAMKRSVQSMLILEEPSPPQRTIIGDATRITRHRKAKAAYDAMRKRRRRQSIAFARIMGQCDDDFAPSPASKPPIELVLSPRRAAIAKFDALLGAPSAFKIVGDDLAEPLSALDDTQLARDREPLLLCKHPGTRSLPANPGEEASRFGDAIFRFLVQSMSMT